MQRDIRPAWLIRLAGELGGRDAGQGQPRNTNLRRSASTAYCALFHRLTLSTARSVLPNTEDQEIHGLARHVSHSALKQVSSYVAGQTPPKHLDAVVDRLRLNHEVSALAATFVELQEQREDADYNHLADFTRPGVLGLVDRAKKAIELIDEHAQSDDFQAFFGLIALRTSIGRS